MTKSHSTLASICEPNGTMTLEDAEEALDVVVEMIRETLDFDPDEIAVKHGLSAEAVEELVTRRDKAMAAVDERLSEFWAEQDARTADSGATDEIGDTEGRA